MHKEKPPLEKTDAELVALALANQEDFLYIIERYKDRLFNYIRRITNVGPEDAEDILQDIFLKIYLNLNDFDQDLKFSSWVYAIARNQVISNHRKLQARAEGHQVAIDDEAAHSIASDIDLIDDMDAGLLKENISRVLERLPDKYSEVLVLKFLEEKNYQEISDIIRRPIGTVGSLLNKARELFKKEYAKQGR